MIGTTISHYKILEELGRGGMGVVYKAQDTKLDRLVALKFLPSHFNSSDEEKQRFIHEAKAASTLDHNNIGTIYEIDETADGQIYMAMALYEEETLRDRIDADQLTIEEALDIAIQIANGLSEAHKMKIVHRDVKPDNIMINKDGVVKIVDFGLAKLSGQTVLTKEGTMMGTLSHMSPEQAQGSSVDHRTDIWSLGVIIYEMISGRKPFQGDYDQAVVYSIINEQPEPLARFKANIPVNLQNIVDRTLTKDAHTRYQSTADLAADLKRTQDKLSDSDNGHPRKKRLSKSLVISTVPALILMFAIYIILFNHRVDPDQSRKNNALLMNPSQWDNSIAVLPFKNISSDAEQEYFCEGMTEQIITNLSRLQNLKQPKKQFRK
jgi:serine/threonine protein kinase